MSESTTSIEDAIRRILVEQLGIKPDDVTTDASFTDLGADSLDEVELVMCLEEEFEIEIPDADAEKLFRVSDAIAYIQKRQDPNS